MNSLVQFLGGLGKEPLYPITLCDPSISTKDPKGFQRCIARRNACSIEVRYDSCIVENYAYDEDEKRSESTEAAVSGILALLFFGETDWVGGGSEAFPLESLSTSSSNSTVSYQNNLKNSFFQLPVDFEDTYTKWCEDSKPACAR